MRRPNGVETHMAHRERLITAVAEDGLELDGVIIQPSTDKQQSLLVWIHGFGAKFLFRSVPARRTRDGRAGCRFCGG